MHGYGMGGLGWLFQLLIFIAVLLILWWILQGNASKNETALDILKKRLAKGEIDEKEFQKLKKEIL